MDIKKKFVINGFVNSFVFHSFPHTIFGSFITNEGIIVLQENDFEAYFNGTLTFYNGELL